MNGDFPESVWIMFQMTFAIITPALIVGAFVERIKFTAVMLFSGLWLIVVYCPVCYRVWGGGWLAEAGVIDFAGGIVVSRHRRSFRSYSSLDAWPQKRISSQSQTAAFSGNGNDGSRYALGRMVWVQCR